MIFMILSIGICRIRCSEKYTENRSFVGVLRIVTKTLQNGSRQLRTDRSLPRNSTDRPKDKVCETGSDSFRKRENRTLSRSRERNPKTGTDNHDIGNITAGDLPCGLTYILTVEHPARFLHLAGCLINAYKSFQ